MTNHSADSLRTDLRRVLVQTRTHIEQLLEFVTDGTTEPARLAQELTLLEPLDEQRERLIDALKEAAWKQSLAEARRKPVRALVLDALDDMQVPQNAAFLQVYIWGRFAVDLETRGFGSLRRDERRSWQRNPDKRAAYVVPALAPSGEARPDLVTRSDWPLRRRIVLPDTTERILDLLKIRTLLDAYEDESGINSGFHVPLERYAGDVLQVAPPSIDPTPHDTPTAFAAQWNSYRERKAWRTKLDKIVRAQLASLAKDDEMARVRAAGALAELPTEAKLWGRDAAEGATV